MLTIIKGFKVITWNYKRLLKHLGYLLAIIYFIGAFLLTNYLDGIAYFY